MTGCPSCRGGGLIEVRLLYGATVPIMVQVEGKTKFVERVGTTFVRCRCLEGQRYKGFAQFDPSRHEPLDAAAAALPKAQAASVPF